ncbi:MAG TPA: hypothetical protein VEJ20_05375, partial [Candidatus Eremiobacteraceae bacterium]|nr:hypothetical protein [Candidatus Eremiobacteraceae bacterium]
CFPLTEDGLGKILARTRLAALDAHARAIAGGALVPVVTPEIDIFTAAPMRPGERTKASEITQRTASVFAQCAEGPDKLHVATWRVPKAFGALAMPDVIWDRDEAAVLRCVLMKPEHAARVDDIVRRVERWPQVPSL